MVVTLWMEAEYFGIFLSDYESVQMVEVKHPVSVFVGIILFQSNFQILHRLVHPDPVRIL